MTKLPKLISDEMEGLLNKAVAHEYTNGQIYFGISSWMANVGFNQGAELFQKWGEEEHGHGEKVKEYIDDRNAKIVVPSLDKGVADFKDIPEILMKVFDREVETEKLYSMLATKALREGDFPTLEFTKWFTAEQREEIVKARKLVDKANLLGGCQNFNYFMDEEFGELL